MYGQSTWTPLSSQPQSQQLSPSESFSRHQPRPQRHYISTFRRALPSSLTSSFINWQVEPVGGGGAVSPTSSNIGGYYHTLPANYSAAHDTQTHSQQTVADALDTSDLDHLLADLDNVNMLGTSDEWRNTFRTKRDKFMSMQQQQQSLPSFASYAYHRQARSPRHAAIVDTLADRRSASPSQHDYMNSSSGVDSALVLSDYDSPTAYASHSPAPPSAPLIRSTGGSAPLSRSGSMSDFWREALQQQYDSTQRRMYSHNGTTIDTPLRHTSPGLPMQHSRENSVVYRPAPAHVPTTSNTVDFGELNKVVEKSNYNTMSRREAQHLASQAIVVHSQREPSAHTQPVNHTLPKRERPELAALTHMSDLLRQSADMLDSPTGAKVAVDTANSMKQFLDSSNTQLGAAVGVRQTLSGTLIHIPSPIYTSPPITVMSPRVTSASPDSSTHSTLPAGLPSPRPAHAVLEQLAATLEPRSPVTRTAVSVPWASVASAAVAGTVRARVMHIDSSRRYHPTASLEQTYAIAYAPPRQAALASPAAIAPAQSHAASIKAMTEDTVFRTKPVIQVNLSLSSPKTTHAGPLNNVRESVATTVPAVKSPRQQLTTTHDLSNALLSAVDLNVASTSGSGRNAELPPQSPHIRHIRPGCLRDYKQFHYPRGQPMMTDHESTSCLRQVENVFKRCRLGVADIDAMAEVCRICRLPLYVKAPLLIACAGKQPATDVLHPVTVTYIQFAVFWKKMTAVAADLAARFVYILTAGARTHLMPADFEVMLQDIIDTFPGFDFLRASNAFHPRYIMTVTARIFWAVNRSWTGRITILEMRKSNFLKVLQSLESANDINAISEYFSYEHFYVVYCKFWELDTDHDMLISRTDLSAHSSGALTSAVINRIFSGCVQRHKEAASTIAGMLTYTDFVYLLMADEDKANPAAIEYWFRILDVDGDGVLSFYELETFYMAVKQKLLDMSVDPMSFTDVLCQMLDVINYRSGTGHGRDVEGVRLADLKRAGRMAATFLNAFINVVKYYDQEVESGNSERNATLENETGVELSAWERYCTEEYEMLMADEQAMGGVDDETEINCDSDGDDAGVNGDRQRYAA